MIDFLAQGHPVSCLYEGALAEEGLGGGAPKNRVYDGQKVDLRLDGVGVEGLKMLGMVAPVIFVVDLFKLAEDDSSRDDAVSVIIVFSVVKAPQCGHAFQHVLNGRVLVKATQQLSLIHYALRCLVLRHASQMTSSHSEDGVEEMGLASSNDGDNQLKVPVRIAKIQPMSNLVDVVPHQASFLDIVQREASIPIVLDRFRWR